VRLLFQVTKKNGIGEKAHSFRGGEIGVKSQLANQPRWQIPDWNHHGVYASISFPGAGEAPPLALAGEVLI